MKKIMISMSLVCFSLSGYNKQHVALLKKKSSQKEKNINVSRCDFRGAGNRLKGIKCIGAQLSGANFSKPTAISKVAGIISIPNQQTDLTGADFSNSECISTDFSHAILKNVNFSGANIEYANFSGADLTGVKFLNAMHVEHAIFCGAIMPDGSICNGMWQNKSKTVTLYCNCPAKK